MVFSSLTFLFAFLPLTLLLYYLAPKSVRNVVLLAASLFFYSWGEGLYVLLMLWTLALNYAGGLLIDRLRGRPGERAVLTLFVALNLALLAVFKYANFIVDNLNVALEAGGLSPLELDPVHLPIGISFFTFQALSYLVDVYRRQAPVQRNPLNIALYVSMFPQLIAGPIVRYHDVAKQILERTFRSEDFAYGVRRFVIGLGKKVLIANVVGRVADQAFDQAPGTLSAPVAWLGVVCYAFQIYFDFSGYSDMAIGLGRMFGFRFLENFRYPYIASSIQEFWRRWHISLSSWFRDYLYIPLGGNRKGSLRVYLNLVTVFFLCGLWHGASWNFVIWGLIHGLFLVSERLGLTRLLGRAPLPVRHMYALLVVLVGWVFFRATTLPEAVAYLGSMFGAAANDPLPLAAFVNGEVLLALAIAIPASLPIVSLGERWSARSPAVFSVARLTYVAVVFSLSVMYLTADTYNPFIYFRF
jgi:alginate O-acetyltransferase complex protein AlgI